MSSIGSGYTNTSRRSYVSTAPFQDDFFTYQFSDVFPVGPVGNLVAVTGANESTCPAGRILKEIGRKLYPGVDAGINTYLVKVYDDVTFLSGFIDPNSPVFAVFNTDKPYTAYKEFPIEQAIDPNGGLNDVGPPVYTNGLVQAKEYISTGSMLYSGQGLVSVSGQNRVSAVIFNSIDSTRHKLNVSLGQVFTFNLTAGTAMIAATSDGNSGVLSSLAGSVVYMKLTNSYSGDCTITFDSQIRESVDTLVISTGDTWTLGFICDGSSLLEFSRTHNTPG